MLREGIADELRERLGEDSRLFPDYEGYCFANIPETILSLFGTGRGRRSLPDDVLGGRDASEADNVVLFLFDGFGYEHWKQAAKRGGFFDRWSERGRVTPLTTIFPSTTSAALTTIHTGLTPQEHGLPEWTVYYEEFGEVIQTLPFMNLEGDPLPLDPGPDVLFDGDPVYGELVEEGVEPLVFVRQEMVGSEYSQLVYADAEVVPYMNLPDLAVKLRRCLEEGEERQYVHVYVDYIDSAAHYDGPGDGNHRAQIRALADVMERAFLDAIDPGEAGDTLLLATADHGHISVDPEETVDLYSIEGLRDLLARTADGGIIPPTGGARDVMLHAGEGKIDELVSLLRDELDAMVMRSSDAVDRELFGGGDRGERFLDRIGDVLVLPDDAGTVWYTEEDQRFELQGHHGGLSEDEMLVPFAVGWLDELVVGD